MRQLLLQDQYSVYPSQVTTTMHYRNSHLKRRDEEASSSLEALEPLSGSTLTIAWFCKEEMKPVQRHKREMTQKRMNSKLSLFSSIQPFVLNRRQWTNPYIVSCLWSVFLLNEKTATGILPWCSVQAMIMSLWPSHLLEWDGYAYSLRILHSIAVVHRSLLFHDIPIVMRCNRTVVRCTVSGFKTSVIIKRVSSFLQPIAFWGYVSCTRCNPY